MERLYKGLGIIKSATPFQQYLHKSAFLTNVANH